MNNNNNNKPASNVSSTKCDIVSKRGAAPFDTAGLPPAVSPLKSYANAELLKQTILKENRNQSGIYRWVNNLDQNSYVGSAVDLAKRLGSYYNKNFLLRYTKKNTSLIYAALLKHDYKNFTLDILEYCSPEQLIAREQYYMDMLNPKYNILK